MPHRDKLVKANTNIFKAIFPVQTKSVASILVWSIILLADLVLAVLCVFHFGIVSPENFSEWTVVLILVAVLVVFWLQGVLWSAITKVSSKR